MFIARVKQECEGRFVLGTGTCMDLAVEKKEAVTEELHSAPARTPGSACTVSGTCGITLSILAGQPKQGPCSMSQGAASGATSSSTFIYFQPYFHILSRVLRRASPSQKSLQTNTKEKTAHLSSSAEGPRTGLVTSQNSTRNVLQTSSLYLGLL